MLISGLTRWKSIYYGRRSEYVFMGNDSAVSELIWVVAWYQAEYAASHHLNNPNSKVHGANMGPIWGRQDPGGPHVGPMNFAIWEVKPRSLEHQKPLLLV